MNQTPAMAAHVAPPLPLLARMQLVTIVDPHIKRDPNYRIHKEALDQGLYIRSHDGTPFEGHCWPGSSSYPDYTDARVRAWWAAKFSLDQYKVVQEVENAWQACRALCNTPFEGCSPASYPLLPAGLDLGASYLERHE